MFLLFTQKAKGWHESPPHAHLIHHLRGVHFCLDSLECGVGFLDIPLAIQSVADRTKSAVQGAPKGC